MPGSDRAPSLRRRISLRHLIFLTLLATGIAPLVVISALTIGQNRRLLEDQERAHLAASADALSREMSDRLAGSRRLLGQIGAALMAPPGDDGPSERLRKPWVRGYLAGVAAEPGSDLLALRVLDAAGEGPRLAAGELPEAGQRALDAAFERALAGRGAVYEPAVLPGEPVPAAAVAVPVFRDAGPPVMVVEALVRLSTLGTLFPEAGVPAGAGLFLLGGAGEILWSRSADPALGRALAASQVVADFRARPLSLSGQYEAEVGGEPRTVLVQVAPVGEAGWAVVAQRPLTAAFGAVDRMVVSTAVSALLLIALALVVAALVANRLSRPIDRLAETSHQIAAGNFGGRVEIGGLATGELVGLAENFNRMSGELADHVERLRQAARTNRELFLGTLRAFVAAVDAKDPYTRGHSERVAEVSRTLARHLGLSDERVQRVWIAALVHDVGKIGIDDKILKKGGLLTEEELARMREHPAIGADILEPIESMRDTLAVVRWHHECWNGRGYPDGLRGEEIPLEARIVAVADTFDAITTHRPYQEAYSRAFAVETIERLAGSRFDAKVVTAFLGACNKGEIDAPEEPAATDAPAGERAGAAEHRLSRLA
jgi:HD-GYP domain-containing protein (c-di-GMP phosphodiesterase class II)